MACSIAAPLCISHKCTECCRRPNCAEMVASANVFPEPGGPYMIKPRAPWGQVFSQHRSCRYAYSLFHAWCSRIRDFVRADVLVFVAGSVDDLYEAEDFSVRVVTLSRVGCDVAAWIFCVGNCWGAEQAGVGGSVCLGRASTARAKPMLPMPLTTAGTRDRSRLRLVEEV